MKTGPLTTRGPGSGLDLHLAVRALESATRSGGECSRFPGGEIGTRVVDMMLKRARVEGGWGPIRALAVVANEPSNARHRRLGFSNTRECEIGWSGRTFHSHSRVLMP
jgi:hypothetical protein